MDVNIDWKKKIGFPINYDSGQSSEDGFDAEDVVVFRKRESARLLADRGDGAEADLLGSTPPRTVQRHKERNRKFRSGYIDSVQSRHSRRSIDDATHSDMGLDRDRKRMSHRLRAMDRESKGTGRADSLPAAAAVPTLVESCNRFMCLSSRLKDRDSTPTSSPSDAPVGHRTGANEDPNAAACRESFYQTFSILINMGNIDKGCKRTISREEQVWQSELKDMIWLELQAKVAGRSLAQQDAFLCQQRAIVPTVLQNIRDYRFANPRPCKGTSHLCALEGSKEDLTTTDEDEHPTGDEGNMGCLSFNCQQCIDAVGLALREVGTLLESFYNAGALYPSSKAITEDHPLIASNAFQDRLKAMCLWYNTALHMRLKILAIRRMLRTMRWKIQRRIHNLHSTDSQLSRQSSDSPRPSCHVKFNVSKSNTPNDSNNSDSSHSDSHKDQDNDNAGQENDNQQINNNNKDNPGQGSINVRQGDEDQKSYNANHNAMNAIHENDDQGQVDHDSEHGNDAGQINNEEQNNDNEGQNDNEEQNNDNEGQNDDNEIENNGQNFESGRGKNLRLKVTDDVDVKKTTSTGQSTPEIVISDGKGPDDNKAGPTDTQNSSESGYSTAFEAELGNDVYDLGCLNELTGLKLLNKCQVSPLRVHHQEMLKTMGVRRMMQFINKLRANLLGRVHLTLDKPHSVSAESKSVENPVQVFDDTKEEEDKLTNADVDERAFELRRYGCWSEECLSMKLPSYRSHFLLLSSIGMEAVHDYLTLRLEDTPKDPSCLTAKQLLHELKEGLDIATEMRASYSRHIEVALRGVTPRASARADLLSIIRTFDATIETVLKQYLSYLRTMSEVEHMPRHCLQAEWAFTARLAKRVACAAVLAPLTFSEIACIQLDRVVKQFENKFKKLAETTAIVADPDRHIIYALCREAQSLYASEKDATLQCAQWARALAARLKRAPNNIYNVQRANILDAMMRVRDCVVEHATLIADRSREICTSDHDTSLPRVRELLLQLYKLGFELHKELYKLAVVPTLPSVTSSQPQRPVSLQAVKSRHVTARRPETVLFSDTDPTIHKELHRFMNDLPRGGGGGGGLRRVTSPNKRLPVKFSRSDSINEENLFDDKLFEHINHFGGPTQTSIELLLSGEKDRTDELPTIAERQTMVAERQTTVSDEERRWAVRVSRAIVEFARLWMGFVIERCDEGRGLRPRWASQGLEFLMLACEPCNTTHLTDQEFEELKKAMDGCISHVVGKRSVPRSPDDRDALVTTPADRKRRPSPKPLSGSPVLDREVRSSTPTNDTDPMLQFKGLDTSDHTRRVIAAISRLDHARDDKLHQMRVVGHVLDSVVPSYEPKLRQVTFKWQRGLKIGAGTFGKVYTVVNTESGQLLAMKELSIGVGDRRALQRAANELRVLEGVIHPHLVRYYGCELHREEMLIFMELCVEGSLEALVATAGALEEPMVRRYTKQLVSAVIALHARNIAHRDIKSGNIFLTNEGHCLKLGDFGCAVKIRANTTAAGELQGCVGTQAYMAPEVFMKCDGHGRAADVWSLGCVVTEMASGKRPFSEYDSNYQIMFVVGMGGRPSIPPSLSDEGRRFCLACLTHDADQRPKAHHLADHHFLKIKSDEDCKCVPAYLIT